MVANFVGFASKLEEILPGTPRPPTLATDLLKHIDDLSEQRPPSAGNFRDVDEQGTRLWNLSSKLKKDEVTSTQLICLSIVSYKP